MSPNDFASSALNFVSFFPVLLLVVRGRGVTPGKGLASRPACRDHPLGPGLVPESIRGLPPLGLEPPPHEIWFCREARDAADNKVPEQENRAIERQDGDD